MPNDPTDRPPYPWRHGATDVPTLGRKLAHWVVILYFLRVPLLALSILAALPWVSLGPGKELLENLVRDLSFKDVFLVSLMTFLTAATAVAAVNLTLLNGDERFGVNLDLLRHYGQPIYAVGLLAAVWLPGACAFHARGSRLAAWIAFLLGLAVAVAAVIVTRLLQNLLAGPIWQHGPRPLDYTTAADNPRWEGPRAATWLHRLGDRLYRRDHLAKNLELSRVHNNWFVNAIERLLRVLPKEGYFWPYEGGGWGALYSGVWYAVLLSFVTLMAYAAAALAKGFNLGAEAVFPTLAFLVLLVMVACWALSAIAFLLDRYRAPLLSILVGSLLIGTLVGRDYVYTVHPPKQPLQLMSPARTLAAAKGKPVVLVAAAGGGIQAAAWTARVLSGLQEEIGEPFGKAIRLISGVSGGSVGALYFANAFQAGTPTPESLLLSRQAAMAASLDDIAWGLVIPDLIGTLVPHPFLPQVDRGWALETALSRRGSVGGATLREWASKTGDGPLPPVIFNATLVENGQPLLLSTTGYPERAGPAAAPVTFWRLSEEKWDISVATAVRLSASFPFVSPNARAAVADKGAFGQHVADGGYYDNYGTVTLAEWLDAALADAPDGALPKQVLVLEILSFPAGQGQIGETNRGWPFQLFAPFKTLVSVRTASQRFHSEQHLRLLARLWAEKEPHLRIDLEPVEFAPVGLDCEDNAPPLSWRLRDSQKACIERAWEKQRAELTARVASFLETGAP